LQVAALRLQFESILFRFSVCPGRQERLPPAKPTLPLFHGRFGRIKVMDENPYKSPWEDRKPTGGRSIGRKAVLIVVGLIFLWGLFDALYVGFFVVRR